MPFHNPLAKLRPVRRFVECVEPLSKAEREELRSHGFQVLQNDVFYELEPEAVTIARNYGNFYVARYEQYCKRLKIQDPQRFQRYVRIKRCNPDGSLTEERKTHQFRMGLTQIAFHLLLQQLHIPSVHNDPTVDWRDFFKYDFYVPFFGSIDIKSVLLRQQFVNVNVRDLKVENPDYVIALMLDVENPTWIKVLGCMPTSTVRQFPVEECYRRYYCIPVEAFDNAIGLLKALLEVRNKISELENKVRIALP